MFYLQRVIFFLAIITTPLFAKAHPLALNSQFDTDTIFIQQAGTATLRKSSIDPSKYELVLRGVFPKTLFVSDHSKHQAGTLSLQDFLMIWEENSIQFENNGPSAVMSYMSFKPFIKEGVQTDSLELNAPIYEASSNSLRFIATPKHNSDVKTGRFKNVVVVYDGLSVSSKDLKTQYKNMQNPIPSMVEKRLENESL